jgi:hypothetical protein
VAEKVTDERMKLTELLSSQVVAQDGRHLGRVVELRSAGEPEHGNSCEARIVTELIFGKAGWLERLGFRPIEERRVAWSAVLSLEEGKIMVRETEVS